MRTRWKPMDGFAKLMRAFSMSTIGSSSFVEAAAAVSWRGPSDRQIWAGFAGILDDKVSRSSNGSQIPQIHWKICGRRARTTISKRRRWDAPRHWLRQDGRRSFSAIPFYNVVINVWEYDAGASSRPAVRRSLGRQSSETCLQAAADSRAPFSCRLAPESCVGSSHAMA